MVEQDVFVGPGEPRLIFWSATRPLGAPIRLRAPLTRPREIHHRRERFAAACAAQSSVLTSTIAAAAHTYIAHALRGYRIARRASLATKPASTARPPAGPDER